MKPLFFLILFTSSLFALKPYVSWDEEDLATFSQIEKEAISLGKVLEELRILNTSTLSQIQVEKVLHKNSLCDSLSKTFFLYFLQKRLSAEDPFLTRKLTLLHQLVFLLGEIKETGSETKYAQFQGVLFGFKKIILKPQPYRKNF